MGLGWREESKPSETIRRDPEKVNVWCDRSQLLKSPKEYTWPFGKEEVFIVVYCGTKYIFKKI